MSTLLGGVVLASWAAAIISETVRIVQSWKSSLELSPIFDKNQILNTNPEPSPIPTPEVKRHDQAKPDQAHIPRYYAPLPQPPESNAPPSISRRSKPIEEQESISAPFSRHATDVRSGGTDRDQKERFLQPVFLIAVRLPDVPPKEAPALAT